MRIWAACACALLLLSFAPTVSAATVALHVDSDGSDAAATCPPEVELRHRIRVRLGYDPFATSEGGAELRTRVAFESERAFLVAEIEAHTASELLGRRRIVSRSANCDELTTAVALAISFVIEQFDSTHAEHDVPAHPRLEQVPPEVTAPAKRRAPDVRGPDRNRHEDHRRDSIAWSTSAGGAVVFGAAPAVDPALELRLAARRAWWSLALGGRLFAPTTLTTAAGTVRTELASLSAMFCAHSSVAVVCPFAAAGELRGVGTSDRGTRQGASIRLAVGVRAGIEWRFGSAFGIGPYLEGAVSPAPTTLYLGREAVWTSPTIQGAFGLDWIMHFDGGRGRRHTALTIP